MVGQLTTPQATFDPKTLNDLLKGTYTSALQQEMDRQNQLIAEMQRKEFEAMERYRYRKQQQEYQEYYHYNPKRDF